MKGKNQRLHVQGQRLRRQRHVRKRLHGSTERPRLAVFRSLAHIYCQIIDDTSGRTLVHVTDTQPAMRELDGATKTERAKRVGQELAARAKEKGITSVVFDRGGFLYHGRVKALADGAREGGLEF